MTFDVARLDAAALLGRAELPIELEPVRRSLAGRRVLITGAGGSVGTALAEMIAAMEPASLALLDHHEHALFDLYRRFGQPGARPVVDFSLADVRRARKLRELLLRTRPQVVFHLAAYKHVPLGELFPDEVLAVNVLATQELLELCVELEVEAFAYPSSDKAVNPPSLYGATKRLAETLVQRVGSRIGRSYSVARYVNIIGTRGSVIETMAQQIERGEPVTVTDAAMTRYWITMAEAVWLITSVVSHDLPSGVWMLDAQPEVAVVEMAQHLAQQLGSVQQPHPVQVTGLRPGERLREQLLSPFERFEQGPATGMLQVVNEHREQNLERVDRLVAELRGRVDQGDPTVLKKRAMAAATELQ